jgi:hypothetical protein
VSYQDNLENCYQIPENASPAGLVEVEAELVDFATGQTLIDANSEEALTSATTETLVLSADTDCTPVVIANEATSPVGVEVINRESSEVSTSLLGIPRTEVAKVLFDIVNIYGANPKEFVFGPLYANYKYVFDPGDYIFDGDFGFYWRHLPAESAIQAYVYPKPRSFAYPSDDGSGRFPGNYDDGTMTAFVQSTRAFRYQPGRVTGFTMGVRMSTQSNYEDEVIQWGCRNDYGDGYYFQLERGTDLYIVRTSPGLGTLKVARSDWNGDKLLVGEGRTGWGLDPSKVTMYKIEFSWYGAVGASFLAYVPDGVGEGRWVRLHRIFAENQFTRPSLQSAYMKLFTQVYTTAGATSAAFINLYGSSVYIDGGDDGTLTIGSTGQSEIKNIDSTGRSILGLQMKSSINGVGNQKIAFPTALGAYSSVAARFDLVFQRNEFYTGEHYYYGNGTTLVRANSATLPVVRRSATRLEITSGLEFPDISNELAGSTTYLSGRRVKVIGAGIFNTHVTAINGTRTIITTDRPLPAGTTSISLARFDAYAVASGVITSGVTDGIISFSHGSGQWRLGALSSAATSNDDAVWFTSKYARLLYNKFGQIIGDEEIPYEPWRQMAFSITFPSGTTNCELTFRDFFGNIYASGTLAGVTNPWPISLIAEVMPNSSVSDVVVAGGSAPGLTMPGSGFTQAIAQWTTISGLTQDSSSAGGVTYSANKFEGSSSDPLSAVLVDKQGYRVLKNPEKVGTYFVQAGESKQFDLTGLFKPEKMFLTGRYDAGNGALFVVATARNASGVATVNLDWVEQ